MIKAVDSVTLVRVNDGAKGNPTGVTASRTEPSSKYTGMLWKCTGNISGKIKNATYRWNGSSWELYVFKAANIDVNDLFAQNITAKHMTIEGDSTFSGELKAASGTFAGNISADSVTIGKGDEDAFDYGIKVNASGVDIKSDVNGQVTISPHLKVNSRTTTNVLDVSGETVNVNGTLKVNNKDVEDMFEPKITRSNAGVYYKDGYTCHLQAWWVNATDVFFTIGNNFKPKRNVTCVGFCIRKDDARAFPLMCELLTDGTWQVWAMTSIGTNGGGGMWVVYQPGNGIDHRSEFTVCVTGSWLTNSNGG